MVKIAAYGTWTSPIGAEDVATAGASPQWIDVRDGECWWTETRPAEEGRVTLVRRTPAGAQELLPAPWNVRNRVHEYGGKPFALVPDGRVVFTHWGDQRLYVFDPDGSTSPTPVSPEPDRPQGHRYSELVVGTDDTVWCVRETVTGDRPTDVRRELVAVPLSGAASADPTAVRYLASSHHFLTAPKPSPDGARLAWIGWNHPAMPWDGTELCVAEISEDGSVRQHRVLAGGARESVCQVEWAPDGELYALTDPKGWWNPHRIRLDGHSEPAIEVQEEIGGPLWVLGSTWFAPLGGGRHLVLRSGKPAILDEKTGAFQDLDTGWPVWTPRLAVSGNRFFGIAAGEHDPTTVLEVDFTTGATTALTERPAALPDPAYLPTPETRSFVSAEGERIPAFVHPPTNPDFTAPEGELPPYLVHVHGGPTGASSPVLQLGIAFFTSRGIGVVDVNYGGSTGYGRRYRERLVENWGVVDVADCATVAEALGAEGVADPERLAIRGGSAGGWTTAASLTNVPTYRCGTSMFPILDLEGWTGEGGETHDFESHYLHSLVGPYPETAQRYRERSPLNHVEAIAGPVLFLQGLEDEICPPAQVERFVAALAGSGTPHAYVAFDGEQHGFRRAETITRALETELAFYGRILGFDPPETPSLELRS